MAFNKGEWSELYVFLKVLAESKIVWADSSFQRGNLNDFVEIVSLRHNQGNVIYRLRNQNIFIENAQGEVFANLEVEKILSKEVIRSVLQKISEGKGRSFESPQFKNLLQMLYIDNFKGSAREKQDINVDFQYREKLYQNDPLSIKSFIGGKPTLLNASLATNFVYKIVNFNKNMDQINSIETGSKIRDRILTIQKMGGNLLFEKCKNTIFQQNLKIIDADMLHVIPRILLDHYSGSGSKISSLVQKHEEIIKIKRFLRSVLLGMFPTQIWDGEEQANGVIVAQHSGELVLFHILRAKILNEYLFLNTKLDTPSSSRHKFGFIYREGNEFFMDLNLQIRHI